MEKILRRGKDASVFARRLNNLVEKRPVCIQQMLMKHTTQRVQSKHCNQRKVLEQGPEG